MTDENAQEGEAEALPKIDRSKQKPVAKFEATGGLLVAVWKNDNGGKVTYSSSIEKSYRADSGDYRNTQNLYGNDLLRLSRLLQLADDWIEEAKGRKRGDVSFAGRVR
ncbi:MAG: hypothetical protein ABJZ55_01060 [Fuerstiella sp.]